MGCLRTLPRAAIPPSARVGIPKQVWKAVRGSIHKGGGLLPELQALRERVLLHLERLVDTHHVPRWRRWLRQRSDAHAFTWLHIHARTVHTRHQRLQAALPGARDRGVLRYAAGHGLVWDQQSCLREYMQARQLRFPRLV